MLGVEGPLISSDIWQDGSIIGDVWFEPLAGAALPFIDFVAEDLIFISDELQQAIYISLLTNRRQTPEQVPDTVENDPSGWWNDELEEELSGSYLYTLFGTRILDNTLSIVKEMALEALEWLQDESIASAVEVEVTRISISKIIMKVIVFKNQEISNQFSFLWDNLEKTLTLAPA